MLNESVQIVYRYCNIILLQYSLQCIIFYDTIYKWVQQPKVISHVLIYLAYCSNHPCSKGSPANPKGQFILNCICIADNSCTLIASLHQLRHCVCNKFKVTVT